VDHGRWLPFTRGWRDRLGVSRTYVRLPLCTCGDWMRSEKESPSRLRSRARDLSMRRSLIVSLRVLSLRILVVRTEKSFTRTSREDRATVRSGLPKFALQWAPLVE